MKRFIVKESQLFEYIENKKAEKVFYYIVEQIYKNKKYLKENVSHIGANQSIIDVFRNKKLITPRVKEMLVSHNIINEKYEII